MLPPLYDFWCSLRIRSGTTIPACSKIDKLYASHDLWKLRSGLQALSRKDEASHLSSSEVAIEMRVPSSEETPYAEHAYRLLLETV